MYGTGCVHVADHPGAAAPPRGPLGRAADRSAGGDHRFTTALAAAGVGMPATGLAAVAPALARQRIPVPRLLAEE
ncbi:hypothetical protein ACFQZ4_52055 [Catellatospora coxensis]